MQDEQKVTKELIKISRNLVKATKIHLKDNYKLMAEIQKKLREMRKFKLKGQ